MKVVSTGTEFCFRIFSLSCLGFYLTNNSNARVAISKGIVHVVYWLSLCHGTRCHGTPILIIKILTNQFKEQSKSYGNAKQ
jgi:hypothetical protein